jgi:hypothetical protein
MTNAAALPHVFESRANEEIGVLRSAAECQTRCALASQENVPVCQILAATLIASSVVSASSNAPKLPRFDNLNRRQSPTAIRQPRFTLTLGFSSRTVSATIFGQIWDFLEK